MTDKTDSKERDLMALVDAYAEARHIGGCHTYNAKTAEARKAVIAKLAASAGSEPVAWQVWWGLGEMRPHWPPFKTQNDAADHASMIKSRTEVRPLYLHPFPPEGAGWRPIESFSEDEADEVLAWKPGVGRIIITWLPEGHPDADEGEGWHEAWSHKRVRGITHGMLPPAPPTSSADSRKGE